MDFRRHRHVIDLLFVIALLFLFAFSAIMLVALGASVYQRNVDTMSENYDRRTASAYLVQKLRQSDESGCVRTDEINGETAIVLTNRVGERDYSTWLYLYEGTLREQLLRAELVPEPAAGQVILPLRAMELTPVSDRLYSVRLTLQDGEEESFYLGLRSDTTGDGDRTAHTESPR